MPFIHASEFEPNGELVLWQVNESPKWFIDQLSLARALWEEYHQISASNVRLQWLASRFSLQQVAKTRDMDVHKDHFGKPHLVNDSRFISISHCQGYAAAIAAKAPVGIDVECIHPRVQRVKDRFLSADEQRVLGPSDADLMLGWTAKEAVYKMHGERKIIFKEQMHIEERVDEKGCLKVRLKLPTYEQLLKVRFHVLEQCVLSWVCLD